MGVNAVLTYPGNNFKLGYSNIVKYELNGGTPAIQDEVVSYGEVIKNRLENMDKVGYTFAGWYKENTFFTLWNFANDKVTTDITLYAKWNPKAYTVIYDTQGASAIADKTDVHFNDKELLPAIEPKKSGYEFKGWKMGDKEINNQTTYESLVTDDTQMNITLTAQWKIVKSTVSTHVNNQLNSNMPSTGDKTNVVSLIILILFTSLLFLFGIEGFVKNYYQNNLVVIINYEITNMKK